MESQVGDKIKSSSEAEKVFPHSIFVPYDPINVGLYTGTGWPFAVPYEYTGWRDETMSWKETCYVHGNLNPSPTYRFKGPGAVRFISEGTKTGAGSWQLAIPLPLESRSQLWTSARLSRLVVPSG